ncbi:MAG: CPBP family intramembrane metalloprotease [Paludibacteraceae bacterium]|nr:CPBP family intramembrane metalloprotease [Paludibacteraceae bacterium]
MKKLLIALLLIFGAFIGLVVLMGALMVLAPEWSNSIEGLLFIQGFQTIVLFGVTALVGVWFIERVNPFNQMSLNRGLSLKPGLVAFFFAVAALPLISMLAEWNKGMELPSFLASVEEIMRQMEESALAMTEKFLNTSSFGMMIVNLFVMALLPAVCEEMMFRGWLQRVLGNRLNYHVAIWVSAFIFSAIHFQFYGFVPRMIIGAALGYLYCYTGSLWASIIAHFTNNAAAVITAFLAYNGYTSINFDLIGTGDTWYLSVASVAVCLALMGIVKKKLVKL